MFDAGSVVSKLFGSAKQRGMPKGNAQMKVVLRKCGNSTVVVLPPGVLRDLGINEGQSMTLSTTDEALALSRTAATVLMSSSHSVAPKQSHLRKWCHRRKLVDDNYLGRLTTTMLAG